MARSAKKTPQRRVARTQRQAVLVLGMHRSGTSAIAGVLARLGAQSPQTLMTPTRDNPRGFFESLELKRFHDQLLKSAGSRWKDWEPFPADWSHSAIAAQFAESLPQILRQEFGDAPLALIKDPRICRLLPFWLDVLRGMAIDTKVVVPVRHPLEVAGSLEQRDGLSPSESMLIWLRHVLEAEAGTRGLARTFVSYAEVLRDWRPQAARIAADLGIVWPRRSAEAEVEIDDYLSGELKHHHADAGALQAELGHWIEPAFRALQALIADQADAAAQHALDEIRADFDRAGALFATAMRRQEHRLESLQAELAKTLLLVQETGRKHAEAEARFAARETEIKLAQASVEGRAKQLTGQLAELRVALEKAQDEVQRKATRLGEVSARLQQADEVQAHERKQAAKLEERLKAQQAQHQTQLKEQQAQHQTQLKEQRAQHQTQLKEQETRHAARRKEEEARLKENEKRLQELERRLQEREARFSEQRAQFDKQLKETQRRLEDAARRVSQLHADLAAARALTAAKVEALNAKLELAAQARARQKQQLAAGKARMQELAKELAAATAKSAQGEEERRKLDRALADAKKKLAQQAERLAEMGRAQARLRETLEAKDRNIATRFREIATLTRMLDELERGAAPAGSTQLRGAPSLAAIRRALGR